MSKEKKDQALAEAIERSGRPASTLGLLTPEECDQLESIHTAYPGGNVMFDQAVKHLWKTVDARPVPEIKKHKNDK